MLQFVRDLLVWNTLQLNSRQHDTLRPPQTKLFHIPALEWCFCTPNAKLIAGNRTICPAIYSTVHLVSVDTNPLGPQITQNTQTSSRTMDPQISYARISDTEYLAVTPIPVPQNIICMRLHIILIIQTITILVFRRGKKKIKKEKFPFVNTTAIPCILHTL